MALAVASYGFLAVAARSLPEAQFGRLALVWAVLFTLGPGLFAPLEQDLARRLSRPDLASVRSLVRRATTIGVAFAVGVAGVAVVLLTTFDGLLRIGGPALTADTLVAVATLLPVHLTRGYLAGTGQFNRYALQLAADAAARLIGAVGLLGIGVTSASWYVLLIAISQLIACPVCLVGVPRRRPRHVVISPTPNPSWRSLVGGLSWLVLASLASQALINGGVFYMKFAVGVPPLAIGQFLTALTVTRQPLFFLGALQAPLLPALSSVAHAVDGRGARGEISAVIGRVCRWGAAFTLAVVMFGPEAVSVLFGVQYRSGRLMMLILSAACVTFMCSAIKTSGLIAMRAAGAAALSWVAGVAAFVACLTPPGTPSVRASMALLVGSGVTLLVADLCSRRRTRTHRDLLLTSVNL